MNKVYDLKIDFDVFVNILKIFHNFSKFCKEPYRASYSDVLRLFFKEVENISPSDSLVHLSSVSDDFIFEIFEGLL